MYCCTPGVSPPLSRHYICICDCIRVSHLSGLLASYASFQHASFQRALPHCTVRSSDASSRGPGMPQQRLGDASLAAATCHTFIAAHQAYFPHSVGITVSAHLSNKPGLASLPHFTAGGGQACRSSGVAAPHWQLPPAAHTAGGSGGIWRRRGAAGGAGGQDIYMPPVSFYFLIVQRCRE
jgi:hypothetical protein